MADCPICGLGEGCRNHWVARQDPTGEVIFQVGAMTASEDNLMLLRNKLKNPPLRELFERIALVPEWVEETGSLFAYLPWPLDLRGAVHRALFPQANAGVGSQPALPVFMHVLEDIQLGAAEFDLEHCLPDEMLYMVRFTLRLAGVGEVPFTYLQVMWANGVEWAPLFHSGPRRHNAAALIQLLMGGLLDPLRAAFVGQTVRVVAEEQPDGIVAGRAVDEMALPGPPPRHFGEEIESLLNQRRLQPLLRDHLLQMAQPAFDMTVQ